MGPWGLSCPCLGGTLYFQSQLGFLGHPPAPPPWACSEESASATPPLWPQHPFSVSFRPGRRRRTPYLTAIVGRSPDRSGARSGGGSGVPGLGRNGTFGTAPHDSQTPRAERRRCHDNRAHAPVPSPAYCAGAQTDRGTLSTASSWLRDPLPLLTSAMRLDWAGGNCVCYGGSLVTISGSRSPRPGLKTR